MLPQMRAWGKATGHKLPPTCPSTRSDNGISLTIYLLSSLSKILDNRYTDNKAMFTIRNIMATPHSGPSVATAPKNI